MKKISEFKALIKEEKGKFESRKTPSRFGFSFFDSIYYVPKADWNKIVPKSKGLMRHPYLKAIENSSNANEQNKYVLIYDGQLPVGAAVLNIVILTGEDYGPINGEKSGLEKVTDKLIDKARLRVLVCGHTHLSGDHGFVYSSEISSQDAYHALADACYQIRRAEKLKGSINLVLIKDFYQHEFENSEYLSVFKYRKFKVDPNMVLSLRPEWDTFEDYLNSMRSKYRKKALSVTKKSSPLQRKSLSAEEIELNFNKIQELYFNVANKAKVRINHYDATYFLQLKLELKEEFEFTAYFLDKKMVGFTTTIFWGDNCEGHSIGVDYECNNQYAIYQNILYDDVKIAIERRKKKVILGRTAMEMKSNIGAEPMEMCCYMRHPDPISNRAIKPIFNYIKQEQWIQRSPFKD